MIRPTFFPTGRRACGRHNGFFENFTVPQLTDLLASCHLPEVQKNDLSKTSRVEIATNGCLVTPSDYLVRSLSPKNRASIYAAMESSQFNYAQQHPFRFAPEEFEARFDGSGLSPVIMKTSDMLLLFFPSTGHRQFVIYRRNELS